MSTTARKARVGRDIWTQFAGVVLIALGVAGLAGWKADAAWRPFQHPVFQRHVLCNSARTTSQVQAEVARVQAEIARRQAERVAERMRNQNPL